MREIMSRKPRSHTCKSASYHHFRTGRIHSLSKSSTSKCCSAYPSNNFHVPSGKMSLILVSYRREPPPGKAVALSIKSPIASAV